MALLRRLLARLVRRKRRGPAPQPEDDASIYPLF